MGIVRAGNPAPIQLPGLKTEAYAAATTVPIGLSLDRKTLYGTATSFSTTLQQSVDDGATWTTVTTFPQGIIGVAETDDGEALAFGQHGSGSPGYIYKSTGWATSHTTATWALVLTTVGGFVRPFWSGGHPWAFGDDTIRANTSRFGVLAEYGAQVSSSGDQTIKARRLWTTTDYGATWTLKLDLMLRYPGITPLHPHAAAYDPWWDRIWLTYGDTTTGEGTTKNLVLYSDDRGDTWQAVDVNGGYNVIGGQSTSIAILETCIILGGDTRPGYQRYARRGFRKLGRLEVTANLTSGSGNLILCNRIHQNRGQLGAPLLGAHQSENTDIRPGIVVSLDGGQTITVLWEDTTIQGSSRGVVSAFGPTYNGKIVAHIQTVAAGSPGTGTHWLLRGELVIPEPGMFDGQVFITGDGTTTVFNIPHGLPTTPSRYTVWPEKAAGTYTVTVTSTNIVLTFTTAPASGNVVPFQWRAAP